jgi:hypothetical protein
MRAPMQSVTSAVSMSASVIFARANTFFVTSTGPVSMKPVVPKPRRCAIYTRKSTEHNLDLEFNSLDAQGEADKPNIHEVTHA